MTTTTYNAAGVGTNAWTDPTNAYSDNASYATCAPAKNTSVAGIWTTFGITDPGSATLSDVTVIAQYKTSTTSSIASLKTEISWDGGSSWDAGDTDTSEPAADYDYTVSKWSDTTWDWTKLNNTNLQVRVTGIRGNSTNAVTFSLDVVQVQITYTTVTNISVTDTLSASDAVLRNKTLTETDTLTLTDAKSVNKTLPLSDSLTLTDSKSVDKTLTETDAISLVDSKLVNKTLTVTDTAGLADEISELLKFIFKEVTDSVSLADSVLRDKALVLSESIALNDSVLRDKALTITESVGLADTDSRDKDLTETDVLSLLDAIEILAEKLITDDITLADLVEVEKTAAAVEALGGGSSKPFRWTYIPSRKTPDELRKRRGRLKPRLIVVEDVVHLTDDVRRDIASLLTDAVELTDIVRVEKRLTITDTIGLTDAVFRHKHLMITDYLRLVESLSLTAFVPMLETPIVRARALEVSERITELAKGVRASVLRTKLARSKDPSLTNKIMDAYADELDKLFLAFKQDAAKLLGRRELSDDWDEVDAPDLMDKFNRTIEVTIIIPGTGIVKKFVTRAYTAGGLRSSQFLTSLGIKAVFSIMPADRNAVAVLEVRDLSGLKGITDEMSKQIMKEITDGMLRGDSLDDVAKAIDERVDSIGRVRAEMLARTETMKAFAEGSTAQYDKYGITEVEWLAAPEPTGTCDECMGYDGLTFKIADKPDLPAHPNCRCVWLPVIPETNA